MKKKLWERVRFSLCWHLNQVHHTHTHRVLGGLRWLSPSVGGASESPSNIYRANNTFLHPSLQSCTPPSSLNQAPDNTSLKNDSQDLYWDCSISQFWKTVVRFPQTNHWPYKLELSPICLLSHSHNHCNFHSFIYHFAPVFHSFRWMSPCVLIFDCCNPSTKKKNSPAPSGEVKMEWSHKQVNKLNLSLATLLFASLSECLHMCLTVSFHACLFLLSASVFVSSQCYHSNINPKHQTKEQLKTFTVCACVWLRNRL